MRDLMELLPRGDVVVVLQLTGEQVLAALENSVSKFPAQSGQFLQVSGLAFQFDASKPARSRVVPGSVTSHGKPLQLGVKYSVAMLHYLSKGKVHCVQWHTCAATVGAQPTALMWLSLWTWLWLWLGVPQDGYDMFRKGKVLVDDENGPILPTIIRNHFRKLSMTTRAQATITLMLAQQPAYSTLLSLPCRRLPQRLRAASRAPGAAVCEQAAA